MDVPVGKETTMPAGDKWTGSSSGSGTDSAKEQKRYMQAYLQVIYNLYGKMAFTAEQQKLAYQAYKIRLPASSFAMLIRRKDSMYVKSREYKNRIADANTIYTQFRGYGRVMPQEFGERYARSDMNKAALVTRIQNTKWFQKRFPYWKQGVNQGMISNTGAGATAYISLRNMLNNAFRSAAGKDADPLLHRMMFSSGMTESDISNNLAAVFGGQEALRFALGRNMDADDVMRAALTKKYGYKGLSEIARAGSLAQSYQASKARPFDIGLDEASGNIVMRNI